MNGKRQTIWLVSMLSLMVVLSAYYLFTEDSGASVPKETAGSIQVEGNVKDAAGVGLPSVGDEGVVVNEVVTNDQAGNAADSSVLDKAGDQAAAVLEDSVDTAKDAVVDTAKNAADTAKETVNTAKDAIKETVKDDAAILDEVASQSVSSSSLFTNYLFEREQKNLKNQNDLLAQINDMDKSPSDNAMATEQLRSLEEKEAKITGIEDQLQQKFGYGEAIVKEEGNNYKVVVLSNKLDVKQAVGIVDLVMKELSVTQDKISVQYVSE